MIVKISPVVIDIILIGNSKRRKIEQGQRRTAYSQRRAARLRAIADNDPAGTHQVDRCIAAAGGVHGRIIIEIHRTRDHIHLIAGIEIRSIIKSECAAGQRQRSIYYHLPGTVNLKGSPDEVRRRQTIRILKIQRLAVDNYLPTRKSTVLTGSSLIDRQGYPTGNTDGAIRTGRRHNS